jgi:type I restriction enzyme R subunit
MAKHTENAFETEIVRQMVDSGDWKEGSDTKYDAQRCLYPQALHDFIRSTQYEEWQKLKTAQGDGAADALEQQVSKQIALRGTLDVLRNDLELFGCRFNLVYFQPSSTRDPEHLKRFTNNILTVVRQVHYSERNRKSIDLVLFVNGIPIFTAELKNALTKQNVIDAVRQYKETRSPVGEPFLHFGRCLAHFAVDTDIVQVTTRLQERKTRFIPFNRGRNNGAGNPLASALTGGYATEYLWRDIWSKVLMLDILEHFLHHEKPKGRRKRGRSLGKLIFPRYHQLHTVRSLITQAQKDGSGHNYLIQHSAGSGKSNTIAWLAHRLSQLQNADDERIFNAIIVVTDRRVLDAQLQHTVRTYEKVRGLVANIDGGSAELRKALQDGKQIIVTTLQKFPFIVNSIGKLPGKRFALLIDEAHSSQGGEMHQKMTKVLTSGGQVEDEMDYEDMIHDEMAARGKQDNLSVFAFTATPKAKTLELFGTQRSDGKFHAFSLYSMRQAIEEAFILDVLENYTTYATYWKLNKEDDEDPEVDSSKAKAILRKFVLQHPETIKQKVEIILNHFVGNSIGRINGRAKAMIVTSSRKAAVQYRIAVDKWIKDNGREFKALVAFTDTITLDGMDYTERSMNGVSDNQTAATFNDDDHRLLIVANKYQTGYDQPLLHTMYVDKMLGGVGAVQTLSRLNRVHPGKDEAFVLDFANDALSIQNSFQDYYETTLLESNTDPNLIYQLRRDILDADLYTEQDAEDFCRILLDDEQGHPELVAFLSGCVRRFIDEMDDDEKLEYRKRMRAYYRGYGFLARVMPFKDLKLEEFYHFSRHIAKLLPVEGVHMPTFIQDLVNIDSLRISRTSQGDIGLVSGQTELKPRGVDDIAGAAEEDVDILSAIIETLNERFGANLTDEDRLFLEGVMHDLQLDESLGTIFKVNPPATVRGEFADRLTNNMIAKVTTHEEFVQKYLDNQDFQQDLISMMFTEVQKSIHLTDEKQLLNLIEQGESSTVEFKSTLRYNLYERKNKDKMVEHNCVKTIAAFLNSNYGGNLLIGVRDDKEIMGIAIDDFSDVDKAMLHLTNLINRDIGPTFSPLCNIRAVKTNDKHLIWLKVSPAMIAPAWTKKGDDTKFYVRQGPRTGSYTIEQAEIYIDQHFN